MRCLWVMLLVLVAAVGAAAEPAGAGATAFRPQGMTVSDLVSFVGDLPVPPTVSDPMLAVAARMKSETEHFSRERGPVIRHALAAMTSSQATQVERGRDELVQALAGAPRSERYFQELQALLTAEQVQALCAHLLGRAGGWVAWQQQIVPAARALALAPALVERIRAEQRDSAARQYCYVRGECVRAVTAWGEQIPARGRVEEIAAYESLQDFIRREYNDAAEAMVATVWKEAGEATMLRLRERVFDLATKQPAPAVDDPDLPPMGLSAPRLRQALARVLAPLAVAERLATVLAPYDREDIEYWNRIAGDATAALRQFSSEDAAAVSNACAAFDRMFEEIPVPHRMYHEAMRTLPAAQREGVRSELAAARQFSGWIQEHVLTALGRLELMPVHEHAARAALIEYGREFDPATTARAAARFAQWGMQAEMNGNSEGMAVILKVQDFQQRRLNLALEQLMQRLQALLGVADYDRLLSEIRQLGESTGK